MLFPQGPCKSQRPILDMCGCCISMLYSRPVLQGRCGVGGVQLSGGKEIGRTQTFNFTSWGRVKMSWQLWIRGSSVSFVHNSTQINPDLPSKKDFLGASCIHHRFQLIGFFFASRAFFVQKSCDHLFSKRMIHISTFAIWILTKQIEFSKRIVSQPWKWMTRSLPAWNLLALWFPACETRR